MKGSPRFGATWPFRAAPPGWARGLAWVMIGTGVAINIGFLQTLWATFAYGLILGASMFFGVSRRISFLYGCVAPAGLFCVYFICTNAPDLASAPLYMAVWLKTMAAPMIAAPLAGWCAGASALRFRAMRES